MRLSDKRKNNLYAAIYGPIMDSRIIINRAPDKSSMLVVDIDQMLFDLEKEIANEVWKVLNLKGE